LETINDAVTRARYVITELPVRSIKLSAGDVVTGLTALLAKSLLSFFKYFQYYLAFLTSLADSAACLLSEIRDKR
jgi:hypothetical protein